MPRSPVDVPLTRRAFLRAGGALLGGAALPGLSRAGALLGGDPVLLAIYLRGGADGLGLVVPAGDPAYAGLRPGIAVPPGDAIALDGFFALHPQLAALAPLYGAGELAVVHAAGSPDGSRSHFDAQDYMELATPGAKTVDAGWLNRTLTALGSTDSWSGVTVGPSRALALQGEAANLAFTSLADFVYDGGPARRATLQALYEATPSAPLAKAGAEAFQALDGVGAVPPADLAGYPVPPGEEQPGPFSRALADAAALIRADIGVRTLAIDIGGWDHHENEVDALGGVAPALAGGLAAFRDDLGADFARVCAVVMTEFGRTAAENGSAGTDHGHGGTMFVLGGGAAGGQVITRDGWPGLGLAQLHEGRDLAVTTDFRDVFAEVLVRHLGLSLEAAEAVLPGHSVEVGSFPGVLA